jgi:MFS family permease
MAVKCVYHALMLARLERLLPFKTPEARRLALLFAVVYFAQGMWYLPNQTITIVFKEKLGLSAGQVATFFSIAVVPWLFKPVYGLLSDFVPLFGYRRKSYFITGSALASLSALTIVALGDPAYWPLALLFTAMGFGLAFTDVITDAIMVENGRARGLTGAFQSAQWAAIYTASVLVGLVGGYLAETRSLRAAFAVASIFPLVSCTMALFFVRDTRTRLDAAALRTTWRAIRMAGRTRTVWLIAAFIFLVAFSPSFGPAFLYYQTDTLKFSQQFIGVLAALQAVGYIVGAFLYAPLSRQYPLARIVVAAVAVTAVTTFGYLLYRGPVSAIIIDSTFGVIAIVVQLALLDLAAKSCPPRVEGTYFALLMSVYNAGQQGSQVVGGYLYDWLGFTPLVFISASATALVLVLVPWLDISAIEAKARAEAP